MKKSCYFQYEKKRRRGRDIVTRQGGVQNTNTLLVEGEYDDILSQSKDKEKMRRRYYYSEKRGEEEDVKSIIEEEGKRRRYCHLQKSRK